MKRKTVSDNKDHRVKKEYQVTVTAPTTGTNSPKPGVSKYETKAEDGEVNFCWHINTVESMWIKANEVSIPNKNFQHCHFLRGT